MAHDAMIDAKAEIETLPYKFQVEFKNNEDSAPNLPLKFINSYL